MSLGWRALVGLAALAAPGAAFGQEPARFSLSMFHFNVQYVPGGLVGFPDGVSNISGTDYDDAELQDRIVTESFAPLLELLLAHPTWKLTIELQGYMVEVLQARHPEVLRNLRELVDGGQVELVSFHWSDQLYLAYPRVALERSHAELDRVMAAAGLTLSPVTFSQEGQFGEGVATIAPLHGQTILGLPKNLFRFQHASDADTAAPLYRLGDADVVLIGRGFEDPAVQVSWSFFDDGELWSTNDMNPYMGDDFRLDPAAVAELEQNIAAQEAAGFQIATIEEYVAFVKAAGIPEPALPPILDGTWQPSSTESMFRWMGKSGLFDVLYQCERDGEVLTANVRAIHDLLVAETLLAWGQAEGLVAPGEHARDLRDCWRDGLLGEVSDASGINPFINEVRYGLDHAAAAQQCAQAISSDVAARVPSRWVEVDTAAGTARGLASRPAERATAEDAFLGEADGLTVDAPGRAVDVAWEAVGDSGDLHRVTISATAPEAPDDRSLTVTFPMELDELRLTPGLVDDEVRHYPLDAFDLEDGTISLPVANGLLGLRDDLWLVLDTTRVHVAATYRTGEPLITFRDDTLDPEGDAQWVFYLLEGTEEDALAEATRRNVRPTALVPGSPAVEGGGCTSALDGRAAQPIGPLAALFVLVALARRSRGRVPR